MPVPFSLDSAPLASLPKAGDHVLVLAPHPDDESLGAGGWIYSARHRGAHVRIVFLTDGDAFRLAALTSGHRFPNHAACRALGDQRRGEARAAAAALGVPPASIRFLGYPDRGLAALRHHWTPKSPYRSAHTGRAETGEAGAIPATPFCGEALLGDLVTAFREWRPQYLLFPDPQDDHRDHRATAWFTAKALSQLEDDRPAWIGRYLIHFGRWPAPHGFAIDAALTPPSRLEPAGGDWQVHPLNAAALQAKALAILAHPSQHLWAADLFGAHLRSNELFSREIRSNLPAVTSCRSC